MTLQNKLLAGAGVAAVSVAVAAMFLGGNSGLASVSDNAKVDQSKKVKSNVGDSTVGGDNLALDGISVGGNFSLDKSEKTSNVNSKAETSVDESEETINEGNY